VFGGYDISAGDLNDLWRFSRSAGTWNQILTTGEDLQPATRSGHSAVAPDPTGTKFVIFGGNMRWGQTKVLATSSPTVETLTHPAE